MRKPVPLPDRETLIKELEKAYRPLIDMGIPADELHKVFLSPSFWSGNKKSQRKILTDLAKKYVKVDDSLEEEI